MGREIWSENDDRVVFQTNEGADHMMHNVVGRQMGNAEL